MANASGGKTMNVLYLNHTAQMSGAAANPNLNEITIEMLNDENLINCFVALTPISNRPLRFPAAGLSPTFCATKAGW